MRLFACQNASSWSLPFDRHRPEPPRGAQRQEVCLIQGPIRSPVLRHRHPERRLTRIADQYDGQGVTSIVQPGCHIVGEAILGRVHSHESGLRDTVGVETDHSTAPCAPQCETQPLPGLNLHDVPRFKGQTDRFAGFPQREQSTNQNASLTMLRLGRRRSSAPPKLRKANVTSVTVG